MGSVIRQDRKRITMNEWKWVQELLTQFNKGQFVTPSDLKFRGVIWNEGKTIRGFIEHMDLGFVWTVSDNQDRNVIRTGCGGSLGLVMSDMLSEMVAIDVVRRAKSQRKVMDMPSLL